MYTNTPVDEALLEVKKKLQQDQDLHTVTELSVSTIIYLLKLILTSTTFTFNDKIYQQISGLPMGGRLSAALASITL
ncbi:MAG: hypothetical protein GY820_06030 [Gammaproteobacteria bacterium]|nr:hypothetical protein [Gammaproteobacteria bacterium]